MKVVLICPSNMLYMPYVGNYEKILKKNNIDYDIINWDRFNIEDKDNYLIYRDRKIGHQRKFYDYYKYCQFIKKTLKQIKVDKIIIFGLQLTFFLKQYLLKNYKKKFIIDIRDYNKVLKVFNPNEIIEESNFTVISSPNYKEWLPKTDKYIINHNTNITNLNDLLPPKVYDYKRIIISYIGSLANFQENKELIDSLKNKSGFLLIFHGDGSINHMIKNHIDKFNIKNVKVNGRYNRKIEHDLYIKADLINMILYNKNINDKTCLSNRLYNSVIYGRPMVAVKGTYISDIIDYYSLGIIISSYDNIENEVLNYLTNFNIKKYNKGRIEFMKNVIKDNDIFANKLVKFLSS